MKQAWKQALAAAVMAASLSVTAAAAPAADTARPMAGGEPPMPPMAAPAERMAPPAPQKGAPAERMAPVRPAPPKGAPGERMVPVPPGPRAAGRHNVPARRPRVQVSPAVTKAVRKETKQTLNTSFHLLGKTDSEAADAFHGGKENYSPNGRILIGRRYRVPVFGEMMPANTMYGRDGKVERVSIPLRENFTMKYGRILRDMYGEPAYIQRVPGEGGSTWQEWDVGRYTVRLWKEHSLQSLEMRVRPERREGEPGVSRRPLFREAWLPEGVSLTAAHHRVTPAVARALQEHYGLTLDDWAKTNCRYNKVDLNGDGTPEWFIVLSGPSTSGTGGDSAVWGRMVDGKFRIRQTFTIVRTPVVIEELPQEMPGVYRPFLVSRSGGGAAPEIVRYVYRHGQYEAVPAGDISGVKGEAILCGRPEPRRPRR
ncbi:MAG: hypothetical protein ACFWT7_02345 [Succiniclasticum sp.]|jgi:hypothetical protein